MTWCALYIYPTLSSIADIEDLDPKIQGRDIFKEGWDGNPGLFGGSGDRNYYVYAGTHWGQEPRCLRTEKEKVIYFSKAEKYHYFSLDKDPQEKNNISIKNSERGVELARTLNRLMNLPPMTEGPKEYIEQDEEILKALKSVGYLQE